MALYLTEKDLEDPEVLGEKLITLAEIVIRKHFYASLNEKDDLVSVGVLKALTLIQNNGWSKGKGSFVNYIYAGMRNDMHNYLYHQNKETLLDEDYPERSREDEYFKEEVYDLDFLLVRLVCMDFVKVFGDGIEYRVVEELEALGFNVVDTSGELQSLKRYNNEILDKYGDTVEKDIIGRLLGLVLWKRKEYSK